jgi:hypothetical protein
MGAADRKSAAPCCATHANPRRPAALLADAPDPRELRSVAAEQIVCPDPLSGDDRPTE